MIKHLTVIINKSLSKIEKTNELEFEKSIKKHKHNLKIFITNIVLRSANLRN